MLEHQKKEKQKKSIKAFALSTHLAVKKRQQRAPEAFIRWRQIDTMLRKKLLKLKHEDWWYGFPAEAKESEKKYVICRYAFPDFALFAAAIQYAFTARYFRKKGLIPVIDIEPVELYGQDAVGALDAWGFAFEQKITPKEAVKEDWVYFDTVNSPHTFLKKDCLYLNGSCMDHWIHAGDGSWRMYYRKARRLVKNTWTIKPEIRNAWEVQVRSKLSPADTILGVALREDFTKSADETRTEKERELYKSHPVMPEVEETLQMVESQMGIWKCNKIFLSTERWESMELFCQYFGEENVYCINRPFMTKDGFAMFYEDGRTVLVEENYFMAAGMDLKFAAYAAEVWGLSRCDYLLAAKCSGAIAALTLNGGTYRDIRILPDTNQIARY